MHLTVRALFKIKVINKKVKKQLRMLINIPTLIKYTFLIKAIKSILMIDASLYHEFNFFKKYIKMIVGIYPLSELEEKKN